MRSVFALAAISIATLAIATEAPVSAAEGGLAAHWPLSGHTRDVSGNGQHPVNRGADLDASGPEGKRGGVLELFVDGERVSASRSFDTADYDLTSNVPLHLGTGANAAFRGNLRDLRLYHRALNAAEIRTLARP